VRSNVLLDVLAGNRQIARMKRKLCLAMLALSSGLMMVFAAAVDKCTEKHKNCVDSCSGFQMQCKSRGADTLECERQFKECSSKCDTALKDCQAKK
jgi:hypothetical protein